MPPPILIGRAFPVLHTLLYQLCSGSQTFFVCFIFCVDSDRCIRNVWWLLLFFVNCLVFDVFLFIWNRWMYYDIVSDSFNLFEFIVGSFMVNVYNSVDILVMCTLIYGCFNVQCFIFFIHISSFLILYCKFINIIWVC